LDSALGPRWAGVWTSRSRSGRRGSVDGARSGIRLFDTADIYGNGRARSSSPCNFETSGHGDCFQSGIFDREWQRAVILRHSSSKCIRGSLRRLGRDELDVFLLHSRLKPFLLRRCFLVLDRLREEGLVKRTGVSLRTVDSWNLALKWPQCEVVEVILNLLDQRPMDAGLLDRAAESNIDVIARVPLCFGFSAASIPPVPHSNRMTSAVAGHEYS